MLKYLNIFKKLGINLYNYSIQNWEKCRLYSSELKKIIKKGIIGFMDKCKVK